MNQESLAEAIRISVRELQRWEADHQRARIDNLHDLCEFTGIPMQVCIALNADQPVLYSLQKRRFAFSSLEASLLSIDEIYKYGEQPDEGILLKSDRISTDKHIGMIRSCHRQVYSVKTVLREEVIKTASIILPDLNRIFFDSWGHYAGHTICLPITMDVYQKLKEEKVLVGYLTTERIKDILALHEGVFFYYSSYATSLHVIHKTHVEVVQYLTKVEQKERYLVAAYTQLTEAKVYFEVLGYRKVKDVRDFEDCYTELCPVMYEVELDVLMKPYGPLRRIMEEYNRRTGVRDVAREAKRKGLSDFMPQKPNNNRGELGYDSFNDDMPLGVDDMLLSVDNKNRMATRCQRSKSINLKVEVCQNPECIMYDKASQRNIVSNGIYRTKNGILSPRFLCKVCGTTFSNRTSIFYNLLGLRSPEDKILAAFKFLVKGMPLRGVAKAVNVKPHTVRYWLKVVSEQRGKIDSMLKRELKVPQAELDTLWTFVKKNSLRQRAILWKRFNPAAG